MKNRKVLLTIVIPTRNRSEYAKSAIRSILEIEDDRLELVVHDNNDNNELGQYLKKNITDKRLCYAHDSSEMSTVHNFNASMKLVTGEYVCFIGDDDGVNPEIVKIAKWLSTESIDCLAADLKSFYMWPDTNRHSNTTHNTLAGTLRIMPFSGKITTFDPEIQIKKLLKNGGLYYLEYGLPRAYHGIVKKDVFDLVNEQTGSYFGGLSADIYASLALACVCKKVVKIDYPLTIPGKCGPAQETHHTTKARKLDMENAPHFRGRGEYEWDDRIPWIYSGETIWVESAVNALREMSRTDLIDRFSIENLCAYLFVNQRDQREKILPELKKKLKSNGKSLTLGRIKYSMKILRIIVSSLTKKVINRIKLLFRLSRITQLNQLKNMEEATDALSSRLDHVKNKPWGAN